MKTCCVRTAPPPLLVSTRSHKTSQTTALRGKRAGKRWQKPRRHHSKLRSTYTILVLVPLHWCKIETENRKFSFFPSQMHTIAHLPVVKAFVWPFSMQMKSAPSIFSAYIYTFNKKIAMFDFELLAKGWSILCFAWLGKLIDFYIIYILKKNVILFLARVGRNAQIVNHFLNDRVLKFISPQLDFPVAQPLGYLNHFQNTWKLPNGSTYFMHAYKQQVVYKFSISGERRYSS